MIYVIYAFAVIFLVLCAAMLFVFYRDRHFGIFLMGVVYGASGLIAISIQHWWPLVMGFALVWLLRFMGLEPSMERGRDSSVNSSDKKGTKETQTND
jgi:hypothetical protein